MILCYLRDLVPASFLRSAFLLSFTVLKNRPFILFDSDCGCVFSFSFFFLTTLWGMWNLSSLSRDQI